MSRQSGISLIEILIAVLVLSIGLLGIAGLQTVALSANSISYQYSQAALMVESMAERMRANKLGVVNGGGTSLYGMTAGIAPGAPSANCVTSSCTPANQAVWDQAVFYSQVTGSSVGTGSNTAPVLAVLNASGSPASSSSCAASYASNEGTNGVSGLPCGTASISCSTNATTNTTQCVITVYWDPGRGGATNYSCSSSDPTALKCFALAFQP
ncbi:MAG: type IV pilus modification protein PilV [Nevskia sp.]|nr:type IV pilus modification protein PilV [Nevskia sp.]